jgi:hypothetical protein
MEQYIHPIPYYYLHPKDQNTPVPVSNRPMPGLSFFLPIKLMNWLALNASPQSRAVLLFIEYLVAEAEALEKS